MNLIPWSVGLKKLNNVTTLSSLVLKICESQFISYPVFNSEYFKIIYFLFVPNIFKSIQPRSTYNWMDSTAFQIHSLIL